MKRLPSLKVLNILTTLLILVLPYYIFDGKFFLGGDDTRLIYSYPVEFIRNITFFSWHNVSTTGISSADQYILPFLSVWALLSYIIPSKLVLSYLGFSLPIILGLLGSQKLINELFNLKNKYKTEIFLGSIFYIFSPILILDQYFIFLTAIWLVGVIPINLFLFLRYLKTSEFKYVFFASTICLLFIGILYTLPWVFGTLLPLLIGLVFISVFYKKKDALTFIKRGFVFGGFIVLTQSYWIGTFVISYFSKSSNSFAHKFISQGFLDTFTPTVLTSATGSIFYPLLNLFHRQISFDFEWQLAKVFMNFYDKTIIFNSIFFLVLFFGLIYFRKYSKKSQSNVFIFLLICLIVSLFFFTVNIGPLKDLFTAMRFIPGFIMFRNFFDKFSVGYILIYSLVISYSLVIVRQRFPSRYKIIFLLFFVAVLFGLLPIKQTINSPLWRTDNIYRVMNIPDEYLATMKYVKDNISSSNTILSIPFGASIYTIIKDSDSNNVYVGTSPVKIFSDVNDISGHYSFNFSEEANTIDSVFVNKDVNKLQKILYEYNANYILFTKNIPDEVRNANWLYDKKMLSVQDQKFVDDLSHKKIYTSKNGNYEIYTLKDTNTMLSSDNLTFQKISPVKYRLKINNLKNQDLIFHDTYHGEWKLYLNKNSDSSWCGKRKKITTRVTECSEVKEIFNIEDLGYIFKRTVFDQNHKDVYNYGNRWSINSKEITLNYSDDYYVENADGTINIEMTLYFKQQNYFYFGGILSVIVYLLGAFYVIKKK